MCLRFNMKKILTITLCLVIFCNVIVNSEYYYPYPVVLPTKGAVWPKPQRQTNSSDYLLFNTKFFTFKVTGENCNILQDALDRYKKIISLDISTGMFIELDEYQLEELLKNDQNFVGYLNKLDVRLKTSCKGVSFPEFDMKEKYILVLTEETGENYLEADSIWGILRGLETFSQLIYQDQGMVKINATNIHDYPRYQHRGLLIDTARHFIPVNKLFATLDAMAYNKMNVFHWHTTDDHSFPYISRTFPQLSKKGAFTQRMTYSIPEVKQIIEYAAVRGIRVIAEFDTPGHAQSFGKAYPELLTPCYKNGTLTKTYGPLDPSKPFTYYFLDKLFKEVLAVFPDLYIHLGGDEMDYECWYSNPSIQEFMLNTNITSNKKLQQYYLTRLLSTVQESKVTPIFWEEVFANKLELDKSTILQVWQEPWNETMANITKAGYSVLLSAGYYLDYLDWGGDWYKFYNNEPTNFTGSDAQKDLILGGEACIWTEVVNQFNLESRVWPRASAVAEKLWSAVNADTADNAASRLEEHTCRMNKRGIGAQPPNGPGFCI